MAYAVPLMPPPAVVLACAPHLQIHAEVRWLFVPTPDTLDPQAKSLLLDCAACITAAKPPYRHDPSLDAPVPPEFEGLTRVELHRYEATTGTVKQAYWVGQCKDCLVIYWARSREWVES